MKSLLQILILLAFISAVTVAYADAFQLPETEMLGLLAVATLAFLATRFPKD